MTSREPLAQPHAHAHAHDHGAHDHGAHDHAHHAHAHHVAGLSLLRMSAAQRVSGAAALAGLLWLGVFWALS